MDILPDDIRQKLLAWTLVQNSNANENIDRLSEICIEVVSFIESTLKKAESSEPTTLSGNNDPGWSDKDAATFEDLSLCVKHLLFLITINVKSHVGIRKEQVLDIAAALSSALLDILFLRSQWSLVDEQQCEDVVGTCFHFLECSINHAMDAFLQCEFVEKSTTDDLIKMFSGKLRDLLKKDKTEPIDLTGFIKGVLVYHKAGDVVGCGRKVEKSLKKVLLKRHRSQADQTLSWIKEHCATVFSAMESVSDDGLVIDCLFIPEVITKENCELLLTALTGISGAAKPTVVVSEIEEALRMDAEEGDGNDVVLRLEVELNEPVQIQKSVFAAELGEDIEMIMDREPDPKETIPNEETSSDDFHTPAKVQSSVASPRASAKKSQSIQPKSSIRRNIFAFLKSPPAPSTDQKSPRGQSAISTSAGKSTLSTSIGQESSGKDRRSIASPRSSPKKSQSVQSKSTIEASGSASTLKSPPPGSNDRAPTLESPRGQSGIRTSPRKSTFSASANLEPSPKPTPSQSASMDLPTGLSLSQSPTWSTDVVLKRRKTEKTSTFSVGCQAPDRRLTRALSQSQTSIIGQTPTSAGTQPVQVTPATTVKRARGRPRKNPIIQKSPTAEGRSQSPKKTPTRNRLPVGESDRSPIKTSDQGQPSDTCPNSDILKQQRVQLSPTEDEGRSQLPKKIPTPNRLPIVESNQSPRKDSDKFQPSGGRPNADIPKPKRGPRIHPIIQKSTTDEVQSQSPKKYPTRNRSPVGESTQSPSKVSDQCQPSDVAPKADTLKRKRGPDSSQKYPIIHIPRIDEDQSPPQKTPTPNRSPPQVSDQSQSSDARPKADTLKRKSLQQIRSPVSAKRQTSADQLLIKEAMADNISVTPAGYYMRLRPRTPAARSVYLDGYAE